MRTREHELIARIKRGDDIAGIREWFCKSLIAERPSWSDLTPFEQAFLNQMILAFQAWERERAKLKLH
jgi:hypothetical protein